METSLSSIQSLVHKIKEEMFSALDLYSFVSPSAYDTAWLAMIPHTQNHDRPMFKDCLNWVLNSQKEEGFWGESDGDGFPAIDALPATLASMVALKTWHVGDKNIEKGLAFIHANMEALLRANYHHLPRWFAIIFPAMVELAQATSLELVFPEDLKRVISSISDERQRILEMEVLVDKYQYPPLLSYLETLPSTYDIDEQAIVKHLSEDGSLFQSPSATARAFMVTGNLKCLDYLRSLVQTCPNGVPPIFPMDEGLIKLCMVDQIQKLGLTEYFNEEIVEILAQVYRSYMNQEQRAETEIKFVPTKLYKDSLAFRLLRMQGYNITPRSFCWFLNHEDIKDHLQQNCQHFTSIMYNVFRATDLVFSGEYELEEARSFSRTLLEKTMSMRNRYDNLVMFPNFHRVIEHELSLPWMARLDHLDHRMWIEENKESPLWIGKASFYRLSCLHNENLIQLAVKNFEFLQLIYRNELEELRRWTKEWGLSEMGFGREKTTYCYFAVSASSSLPPDSLVRLIVAKCAILITVADDFFDMEGSINELQGLTEAVQRWDGKGLTGPSKIIFEALDNLVRDIAAKFLYQQGSDITKSLQDIWRETFVSWMMEAIWSKTDYIPSVDEYLDNAMTSIATHTLVLPSSCFLIPSLPTHKLKPPQYETISKLLMLTARLLNDIQSYQKEHEDGKMNLVLLHNKENQQAEIEDSIAYVKEILDEKRKELLEHVLRNGFNDLPKPCKLLHLSCFKVFQMFFNSSNRYDSNTDLLQDIKKAIYIPPYFPPSEPSFPTLTKKENATSFPTLTKKENATISVHFEGISIQHGRTSFIRQSLSKTISTNGGGKVFIPPKFNLCFV